MDKPVLIVDLPELDDNALAGLQNFLQELMIAFEAHYFHRLRELHPASSALDDKMKDLF